LPFHAVRLAALVPETKPSTTAVLSAGATPSSNSHDELLGDRWRTVAKEKISKRA
jgi:hypothetical protein